MIYDISSMWTRDGHAGAGKCANSKYLRIHAQISHVCANMLCIVVSSIFFSFSVSRLKLQCEFSIWQGQWMDFLKGITVLFVAGREYIICVKHSL